jgi:hypothetical protein
MNSLSFTRYFHFTLAGCFPPGTSFVIFLLIFILHSLFLGSNFRHVWGLFVSGNSPRRNSEVLRMLAQFSLGSRADLLRDLLPLLSKIQLRLIGLISLQLEQEGICLSSSERVQIL